MTKYIVVDLNGEIFWCNLGDNVYVIDCKYLELFKATVLGDYCN